MKKTRQMLCAITVAMLFLIAMFTVSARAEDSKESLLLSPAFDIIGARSSMIKSGLSNEELKFTLADFQQGMGVYDIGAITVKKAPDASLGTLKVGSMTVNDGQVIYGALLPMLEFVPASAQIDIAEFVFSGDEETSGAEIVCKMRLIDKINHAPTVANVNENRLSINTISGKSVSGMLGASDPEGDVLTYEIIKYPSHGVIELRDIDCGSYVYTARDGYIGVDSFEYVARDEYGNYTKAARVNVEISRDDEALVFLDMKESCDLAAASVMVERDIMSTSIRAGNVMFFPELKIKRGDFIVMAMKTASKGPSKNLQLLDGVTGTESLSEEDRGYIAAALEGGYISIETAQDGTKTLRLDEIITRKEVAAILSRMCGYQKNASDLAVFSDAYKLDEQYGRSISAMYECGVIEITGDLISPDAQLTKRECAKILYKFMNLK